MGGCTSAQPGGGGGVTKGGSEHEKRFRRAIKLYEVSEVKQLTNLLNRNKCFQSGESPLTLAAGEGHEAVVQALLNGGACADKPDKHGRLPLHIAVNMNDVETVEILLSEKANPNKYDTHYMMTPLHLACQRGFTNIAKRLLEAGADSNDDQKALPPLVYAVSNGHGDCARILLKHGAVPNVVDAKGQSALEAAVAGCDVSSVRALLHYGAQPRGNLICAAALNSASDVIEALVQHGAKMEPSVEDEVPAIIAATARGSPESVDVLLAAGADIDKPDRKGNTALYNAVMSIVDSERSSYYSRYFSNVYRHHARHDPMELNAENIIKCAMSLVQSGANVTKIWDKFAAVFPSERGINFEEMVLCEVLIQAFGFVGLPRGKVRQFAERLILLREYGLLKLLYSAGVEPADNDLYSLAVQSTDEARIMVRWVRALRKNPRTLCDLVRQKLRRTLSWNILYNIELIDLTPELKDMVCITDTDHYSLAEFFQ